jgi:hypothetical protein
MTSRILGGNLDLRSVALGQSSLVDKMVNAHRCLIPAIRITAGNVDVSEP